MIEKIILQFLDPLLFSIIFIFISFYIYIKFKNYKYLLLAFLVFYVLNTAIVSETLLYYYERQYSTINISEIKGDYDIFVFGGGGSGNNDISNTSKLEDATAIRLLESLSLINEKSKIILSGYSIFDENSEAILMRNVYKSINSNYKIILDNKSTNTSEQIKFLKTLNYKQILLVSSASHIPRINLIAKKNELKNYYLVPTHHKIKNLDFEIYDYFPSARASNFMKELLYEIFAYIYFYV
jgi:uncharacterized SAM-binding protein YcdF (DUF218 family)